MDTTLYNLDTLRPGLMRISKTDNFLYVVDDTYCFFDIPGFKMANEFPDKTYFNYCDLLFDYDKRLVYYTPMTALLIK